MEANLYFALALVLSSFLFSYTIEAKAIDKILTLNFSQVIADQVKNSSDAPKMNSSVISVEPVQLEISNASGINIKNLHLSEDPTRIHIRLRNFNLPLSNFQKLLKLSWESKDDIKNAKKIISYIMKPLGMAKRKIRTALKKENEASAVISQSLSNFSPKVSFFKLMHILVHKYWIVSPPAASKCMKCSSGCNCCKEKKI